MSRAEVCVIAVALFVSAIPATGAGAEADFEQFPRPAWWRSQAGMDHSTPWPWEPVRVTGKGIEVWGRHYQCENGALPRQIVNQGEEMLAAPITLKLTADGTTVDLAGLPATNVATPDDAATRAKLNPASKQ